VAVKIKLKRTGKVHLPQYRIVIADSRSARNGRSIEEIGFYYPKEEPSRIEVKSDRIQYWLGVGALPTEPIIAILKITGDWQKFKGLPGAEGTLRVAPPKPDKKAAYAAAVADSESAKVSFDADRDAAKAKLATPKVEETPAEPVAVAETPAEPAAVAETAATEVAAEVEAPAAAEATEVTESSPEAAPAEATE
jgi:small subunit ribosomal protein S16